MKDNNAIDELFREVISPVEFSPSDKVWDSIEKNLDAKGSAGKSKINYKLVAGVAVISLLAVLVAYNYNSDTKNTSNKVVAVKENKQPATQTPIVTPNSVPNQETKSVNGSVNDSPSKSTSFPAFKTPVAKVFPDGSSEEIPGLNDRQELAVIKPKTISSLSENKKDNSDKSILVLPYYSTANVTNSTFQNNTSTAITTTTPVKTEIADPSTKAEIKENMVYAPNAFTPNGDGLNDLFLPQTAENVKEYKLSIYDRAGTLVFETDEINKGWDGRTQNNGAEITKEDVYMWRIELKNTKGEKEHLMGYLNLLK